MVSSVLQTDQYQYTLSLVTIWGVANSMPRSDWSSVSACVYRNNTYMSGCGLWPLVVGVSLTSSDSNSGHIAVRPSLDTFNSSILRINKTWPLTIGQEK